jgi:hypothetical protein
LKDKIVYVNFVHHNLLNLSTILYNVVINIMTYDRNILQKMLGLQYKSSLILCHQNVELVL